MAYTYKQLGQTRENSTNAVSVYSPPANTQTIIKTIIITNTTAGAVTYRLFVDDDGTTYDESTAIAWDVSINAGETSEINSPITMNNTNGNIAYRSSVANALTITIFGLEIT